MKIGIMGAMPEEIDPLLEYFGNYETIEYAKNKYYKVSYKGNEIVLAYSKIGKINATITATTLIEKFECEQLLFSGVAGAVNDELKIGDLIYASKLAQHDLDISIFGHPFGFVPEGSVYEVADDRLIKIAKEVASNKGIKLKEGIIVTGDQFVCDNAKKEWIKNTFNADALEMEGAAVSVTCNALKVPFFILRAISDSADMDAGFNFDEFLISSAKISAEFIVAMVDKLIK
jgi:adenosylhomocysteine/aminodeoxyfutalosine nucleosidase